MVRDRSRKRTNFSLHTFHTYLLPSDPSSCTFVESIADLYIPVYLVQSSAVREHRAAAAEARKLPAALGKLNRPFSVHLRHIHEILNCARPMSLSPSHSLKEQNISRIICSLVVPAKEDIYSRPLPSLLSA